MAKEFRIGKFHLHSDPSVLFDDSEVVTLSYDQTRLCEKYAPDRYAERYMFDAMKTTLINAIQILQPRLPDDFFKDFSG